MAPSRLESISDNESKSNSYWLLFCFAHAKRLAGIVVDESAGLGTIETSGCDDEIGHIEGEETVAIETAWIALGQHKGLADAALRIDVTEIRSREETIVATGTQEEPA